MAPSHFSCAKTLCRAGLRATIDIWHCLVPFPWALVGSFFAERRESCSERRDEVCDCKLHTTQTNDCTQHRLTPIHNTY